MLHESECKSGHIFCCSRSSFCVVLFMCGARPNCIGAKQRRRRKKTVDQEKSHSYHMCARKMLSIAHSPSRAVELIACHDNELLLISTIPVHCVWARRPYAHFVVLLLCVSCTRSDGKAAFPSRIPWENHMKRTMNHCLYTRDVHSGCKGRLNRARQYIWRWIDCSWYQFVFCIRHVSTCQSNLFAFTIQTIFRRKFFVD